LKRKVSRLDLLLHANALKEFPKTKNFLVSLETIRITYNFITEIDASNGNLQNLKSFIIGSGGSSSNPLKKLPESISKLQKLENLSAANAGLEQLPQTIGQILSLTDLDLRENLIEVLPESIVNLKNLETLNLSMNKISKLPKSIKKLKKLKRLNLKGNPISEEEKARLLKELPNCKITF